MNQTRRHWLSTCVAMAAWPAVVAARQHANISANVAAQSPTKSFETLDAESAEEIEAIAAQIIPSTDDPGAREAGVIYFIDRALSTFARDEREAYRKGMAEIQRKRQELFPTSRSVASLISERQMILIRAVEESDFFNLLRTHTVLGFLSDPSYGGNRDKVGWRQIGFDDRMAWEQPFGYYDAEARREELADLQTGRENQ